MAAKLNRYEEIIIQTLHEYGLKNYTDICLRKTQISKMLNWK